ncbi:right-handed parallel beta-helix repeat-containing protein [Chitinophaga sp.]|uniref:right-handed parallel beta-helix repeat-containing protein n=1 Tax=Chitinophaga sp. TaxID=1869181 RepID=UPI0031DAFF09
MKISLLFILPAVALAMISCSRDGVTPAEEKRVVEGELATTRLLASHVIQNGMTLADMNNVIAGASAGDTVLVEAGTYHITGKLNMKPGIVLLGQGWPVFDATTTAGGTAATQLLTMSYTTDISDCLVKGISFLNIRYLITGANKPMIAFCKFDQGKKLPAWDKLYYHDAYIHLSGTDSAVVDNCELYRRTGHPGRGIWSTQSTYTRIINNTIGDGGAGGYFVTAINDTQTDHTTIQANTIERNTALNTSPEYTDHGIYVHSFAQTLIKYNTIAGWPPDASGGGVKARNGHYITIFGNIMHGSGVLLYEYDVPAYNYFKFVDVSYNTINVPSPVNDMYHGIGYWRNNTTGFEYSIRITHNTMPNATIWANFSTLNVSNFNASLGGVFDNDMGLLNLKAGINASGNF